MKWLILFLSLFFLISRDCLSGQKTYESTENITLTILYDNRSADPAVTADHGFSCLVETADGALLFDAGRNAGTFMANADYLNVDYPAIRWVFISHIHGDHTGGLFDILLKCDRPQLYLPYAYPGQRGEPSGEQADRDFELWLDRFRPYVPEIIMVKEPVKIGSRFYSTGMLEEVSYEQALIIPTPQGSVIITGCAHPGILEIIRRAKEIADQEVYLVIGGFHLIRSSQADITSIARELRGLTRYVGPCHCTGGPALGIFKDTFKADYLDIRAGSRVMIGHTIQIEP